MKALAFRHSLAREAASAIGGRVDRRAFVSRSAPSGKPADGLAGVAETPQVRSDNCFPYPERARPAVYGRKR
jgi:hypothetical protein